METSASPENPMLLLDDYAPRSHSLRRLSASSFDGNSSDGLEDWLLPTYHWVGLSSEQWAELLSVTAKGHLSWVLFPAPRRVDWPA